MIPKEKRSEDLGAAFERFQINDMGALADALVAGSRATKEGETLKSQLADLQTKMEGVVPLPKTPDERKSYLSKLGVPTDAKGYGIPEVEKTEEGLKLLSAFSEVGIPKEEGVKLMAKFSELNNGAISKMTAANEQKLSAYKASLGDKVDQTMTLAKKAVEVLYPGNQALQSRLLSDADLLPGLASAGKAAVESPKMFQAVTFGSGSGSLYPSMESKGIK
jgi:hypothetical protein